MARRLPFRYPQTLNWHNVRGVIGGLNHVLVSNEPVVRSMQMAFQDVLHLRVPRDLLFEDSLTKPKQIERILQLQTSQEHLGRFPTDHDVQNVFAKFEECLLDHYRRFPVSYLPNTQHAMRLFCERKIEFGCTTDLSARVVGQLQQKLPMWSPWPIVSFSPRAHPFATGCPAGIYRVLDRWKPKLELHQVIKVGSTLGELEEAHAAGVAFVAVIGHVATARGLSNTSKRGLEDEFRLMGAAKIVQNLDELAACIDVHA